MGMRTVVFCSNKSVIALAANSGDDKKNKKMKQEIKCFIMKKFFFFEQNGQISERSTFINTGKNKHL